MPTESTLKLNNGKSMPVVGLGLWKIDNATCADQVYNAIKTGYRLLDGAYDYGNEKEAGEGVARAIKEGIVKREDLFITSKLWNTFHEKERVGPICKAQIKNWGLEYFDLYVIHFPVALKYVEPKNMEPTTFKGPDGKVSEINVPLHETYAAMEQLYEEGLIKSIGISNYQGGLVIDLLRYAKHPPQVLQIEHHPYLTQEPLIQLCADKDIKVTAYSSFGPSSFRELDLHTEVPLLLEHDTITKIAKSQSKTPAQVLLRWATQRGIAVIPKSNNQGRLQQNLEVVDFDLKDDEIKAINDLNQHLRFNNPPSYGVNIPIFA